MHLLCPDCRSPIDLDRPSTEDVVCSSCGSTLRLEGDATCNSAPSASSLASTLGPEGDATCELAPGLSSQGSTLGPQDGETYSVALARRSIGRFELIEVVGSGTFGTVYKARDPKLDRIVALKVPRAGNLGGPEDTDRFFREARSAAQLQHPSIVRVHEVGEHYGVPYLVSDFVRGMTLADWLAARQPTFRESAALVAEVADALQEAHDHGVIHRDVKPSNILLDGAGRPHITDFGLAKRDAGEVTVTLDGQILGTPAYMSPEQARGEGHGVDGRSDVYSLGVILYLLATGELPFRGNARMLLQQVQNDEPKSLRSLNDRTPRDLETITLKAMAKEPARRYARAKDLADDLRRFLHGEPIHARPVGRLEKLGRRCRRNPLPATLAACLALAVLGGFAGVTWMWRAAERERIKSEKVNEFLTRDLLAQAAPEFNPRGAGITVAELLDIAGSKLGGKFDGQPAIEAAIRETIGGAYLSLGQYAKAEPHLRTAIARNTRLFGPEHRNTLQAANQLALLLDLSGRGAEAEPLMRRNLEACRRALGADDRATLDAEEHLGVLLWHLSKLDEAETLLRRGLDDRARVLGPDHRDTLRSVNSLGLLLRDRARYAEAEALTHRYLEGVRCTLGLKHPDNVVALTNRGLLFLSQGQPAQAEPYFQKAEQEALRILGPEHPITLAAANDYARLLRDLGRRPDAEQALRRCLADRSRVEGVESRGANQSRIDLGALLRGLGRPTEADPLLREACEIGQRTRGPEDVETLRASGEYALLLLETGKAAEAERIFHRVGNSLAGVRGSGHPSTLAYRGHLASALEAQGKAAEAIAIRRDLVAAYRKAQAAGSPESLAAEVALGESLLAAGHPAEAEPLLREVARRGQAGGPPVHRWQAAYVDSLLGGCLTAQERYAEAEPLVIAGYKSLRDASGAAARHRRSALDRVLALYESWGRPDRASAWRPQQSDLQLPADPFAR